MGNAETGINLYMYNTTGQPNGCGQAIIPSVQPTRPMEPSVRPVGQCTADLFNANSSPLYIPYNR